MRALRIDGLQRMAAHQHPGERLYDRLMLGFSDPDHELIDRAYAFRAWADENPLQALAWLPKLRRTGRLHITAQLWSAVAEIVEGRPAHTAPRQAQPAWPAPNTMTGIPPEYEAWKARNITVAAFDDVKKFAPVKVKEAHDLEARARQATDGATVRALVSRAAGIWAALLNIKEPVLCQP